MAKRLNIFSEKKNLFPNLQFSFCKDLGTCDFLLTITNFVQKALDCGCEVHMVGLDFSAAFDRENHKALIFKLRQVDVVGPFLSILTEFLSNTLQRVVVDGQFDDYRNVIPGILQRSVLGPLLFILYTHDIWFGLENMLVSYADDSTLSACISSPYMISDVTESLNRDLSKISTWCNLWCLRLNPNKTQSMIVSKSRTVLFPHPDLLVVSTALNFETLLKFLVLCLTASLLLRGTFVPFLLRLLNRLVYSENLLKSLRINSFIFPHLKYCFPVWSSTADSHLKLLDKNLRSCKILIPNLTISLQHHCFISSLCMLYKIFHNPSHPLHSELPNVFHPRRVTRGSSSINSLSFSPMRFHTSQYSSCFIVATTKLWNKLPSMTVEATELQKFKLGANAFFIGCG